MANAKIDQNREKTAIAVDTNGNVANLLVDAATGRLLIDITTVADTVPVLKDTSTPDDNYHKTSMAWDGSTTRPLLIENGSGLLWCDVLVT